MLAIVLLLLLAAPAVLCLLGYIRPHDEGGSGYYVLRPGKRGWKR